MGLKIVNKINEFAKQNASAMDVALNRMAVDIERLSKMQVPFKKGQLKSSGRHQRIGLLKYKVEYDKEYARYQEFGGDGKRVVKRYSYPGKNKFYLRDSGRIVAGKALSYIKSETVGIKVL